MRHDTEYYFRRVLQLRSDYNTRRGRIPAQQMLRPGLPVPGQHQESDPARSIVLTNLPVLTTVQELFTLFGRYGQITSVKQVAKPSEPVGKSPSQSVVDRSKGLRRTVSFAHMDLRFGRIRKSQLCHACNC